MLTEVSLLLAPSLFGASLVCSHLFTRLLLLGDVEQQFDQILAASHLMAPNPHPRQQKLLEHDWIASQHICDSMLDLQQTCTDSQPAPGARVSEQQGPIASQPPGPITHVGPAPLYLYEPTIK